MDKPRNWFGPLSGILFVVAFVIRGAIVGELNIDPSDSASSVLAELRESADDTHRGMDCAESPCGAWATEQRPRQN